MVSARHKNQTIDQGIHSIVAYYYADATERAADVGFRAYDLYKLAIDLNDNTFWIITNIDGFGNATWQNLVASTGGAVGGDLSGALPNPSVVDLTISGQQQGSILYYNGTNWVVLNPGTDGYVLTTHDVGNNPTWMAASGGGGGANLANTAPVDVTKAVASVGTSLFAARADHKHNILTDVPISIGPVNSEGVSTALARADHKHAVTDLAIPGQTQGDIIFFNGTNWVKLAIGSDGYVLTAHGPGTNPEWDKPATPGPSGIFAGAQLATTGNVTFANSNGISFGMSNFNQITASYTVPSTAGLISNINVSAGTTSNNLSALTFSNSNGLSFGLNGSVITGSYTVPTQTNFVFSNSNGLSFGTNGSTVTGSYTVPNVPVQTNQTEGFYAIGNTVGQSSSSTFDARTLSISGAGIASVGYSGNALIVSVPAGLANINVSAGTTSNNLSALTFSNSNGLSFGLNGSVVTGSYTVPTQSNQTEGMYAIGNTAGQSSSSTFDARTMSVSGAGNISVGYSGNALVVSGSQSVQTQNVVVPSAGTQSATSGTVLFSNSNGISFGMSNSSVITASYTVPSTAGLLSNVNVSAGTTSNNLSAFVFSNSNNVSFGLNGSTITATVTTPVQTNQSVGLYALGNTTQNSSTTLDARSLSFNGLGIITAGYSNGSIQISATQSVQTQNVVAPSAGTQTATSGTVIFSNSNGISFGMSNSSVITASYTVPTQTVQTVGLYALGNTTQNSSTTLDARTLSFNGLGAATVGYSNGSIQISVPTQTAQTQSNIQAIYDGAASISTGTIRFSNSNGLSFGINGQTITGSYTVPSTAGLISAINVSAGTTSNNLSAITFSNSNGLAFGLNGSVVTGSYTVPTQSNQTEGMYAVGNTTGQSSSSTFDARTMSVSGAGNISVGYSGGNLVISGTAPSGSLNFSAGTTSNNLTALTFSNSNGVSFGLNGSVVTGSVAAQSNQTAGFYAVGNTTGQSSSSTFDVRTLSLSGAGIASVGYSGNNIIINVPAAGASVNFSAGTTSGNLNAVTFSNSNGISFGLNNGVITATVTPGAAAGIAAIQGGTQTATSGTVIFSNSNGISFGLSNSSVMTASYTVPTQTAQTVGLYALGNTTQNSSTTLDARTLSFNGLGAATVGYSNGSIQISVPTQSAQTQSNIQAIYDGANSISTGTIRYSNSNGVSFGINGQTLTASVAAQTAQTVGLYALGNTTQNSSTTLDARTLSFNGLGAATVGYSNGSIQISVPNALTNVNISAGTTSNNLTNFVFSNSNNVSFGLNGSTITATVTTPAQTAQTIGLYALGNTTQNSSTTLDARTLSFNGLGIITAGYSNGSIQLSATQSAQTQNVVVPSAGTQTATSGTVVFSNSNGISFGMSNSSVITASYTVPTQTAQTIGLYAIGNTTQNSSTTLDARTLSFNGLGAATVGYSNGSIQVSVPTQSAQTQSNIQAIYDGAVSISTGTIRYSNANGVSFGINGQTLTGSVAAQTNQTIGLYAIGNTTQNSSTTLDARTLSFNGLGAATVGYSNGSIQISVPNALTNINVSAGTTSNNLTNFVFSNSNNVSFGLNGSTVTATVTTPAQTNQTIGLYAVGNTTQNSSTTLDARTLSFNGLGIITAGYSNGSVQISATQSAQTQNVVVPSAGTQSATSGTVIFSNSNGISFGMSNSSVITASYTVPSTAGLISAINVSAGTTSNNLSALTFSNSNGLSFGLNGSVVTGSYTVPTQTNQTIGLYAVGNTTQNSSTTLDARTLSFNGLGAASVGYSNGSVQISVPVQSAQTQSLIQAIYDGANSISTGTIRFSNANGVSFGINGQTLTGSVAAQSRVQVSHLMFPENPWQTNYPISNASFSLQHFNPKVDILATQANLLMALTGNTDSTGAFTVSLGIYTMAGSVMSLASSNSRVITWTSGSQTTNSSVYGGISGTRYRTVGLNWSISAGDYVLGMWFRTTNNGTWNAFGVQGPTIVGGLDGNETNHYLNGYSTSSYSTAMVGSINVTNTNYVRTGGNAFQQPGIIFLGSY